jgi:hypothetical protein
VPVVLFLGHDDVGARAVAADEVIALDGCTGRAPADDAASLEELAKLGQRPGGPRGTYRRAGAQRPRARPRHWT